MSRSGYSEDCEGINLWRGTVRRAMQGRRGQKALRDLSAALDSLPEKRLGAHSFRRDGQVCTLGALCLHRNVDMTDLESDYSPDYGAGEVDRDLVGARLDIAPAMAAEVMFMNDEWTTETPKERWTRMRAWVDKNLMEETT